MRQSQPRVLVVEDNPFIAMETELLVEQCGCAVVGPVENVGDALGTAREARLEGAVLDINIGDERVWPVAEVLGERGVPFVLVTGYHEPDVPERFRDCPLLSKPMTIGVLGKALKEIGAIPA